MPERILVPELNLVMELRVRVAAPLDIGDVPAGRRRIIPILGGTVTGPKLKGRIPPGGADWQVVRSDGVAELHARYTIETDSGALIYVVNNGLRHGAADVLARIAAGEVVDPSLYYFRSVMQFETASPEYAWLMRSIFIGRGERYPSDVVIRVWEVG